MVSRAKVDHADAPPASYWQRLALGSARFPACHRPPAETISVSDPDCLKSAADFADTIRKKNRGSGVGLGSLAVPAQASSPRRESRISMLRLLRPSSFCRQQSKSPIDSRLD